MQKRALAPAVTAAVVAVALIDLVACAPTLDWREARPEGSGVVMLFPCRPDRHERVVRVSAAAVQMQLHSCRAGGATFSLAVADTADPGQVTPLLAALRAQATANLSGASVEETLPSIAGSTPNPQSVRLRIDGKRPDGRPVVAHAAFFVKGLRLYQATVLGTGEPVGAEALETFFASIRLP
jgi:hypothetical protein